MAWFEELFNEDYDRIYFPTFSPERNASEADFIEAALHLPTGSSLLDLACGHGRHALELARRGYQVTGLDLSRRFIAMARQSARENNLSNLEWIVEDMRAMRLEARFAGAYSYFTSFGFFSDEENHKVLENIGRALKPRGRFLLETVNRDWVIHKVEHQPRRWEEPQKGFFLLEDISFNAHTSRIHTRRIIFDLGTQRSVEFDIKLYTHAELEDMLEESGMKVIATYGNKDFSAYSVSSPRMAMVCQKEPGPLRDEAG